MARNVFIKVPSYVLRPLFHIHPLQDVNEANLVMDTALQATSYSARAAIHHTLQTTMGVPSITGLQDHKGIQSRQDYYVTT